MDQGKVNTDAVRNRRRALGTTSIRADDNGILVVGDVRLDVALEQGAAVQVVDGDVEETLDYFEVSTCFLEKSRHAASLACDADVIV